MELYGCGVLTIPILDYEIEVSYINQTFDWEILGQTKMDILVLGLNQNAIIPKWTWKVFTNPNDSNVSNWRIPDFSSILEVFI